MLNRQAQTNDDQEVIAQAFVSARREARALDAYPGPLPLDLAESYRIQGLAIGLDGRAVAAWKVGRINHPYDAQLGSDRLAGPVFAPAVIAASAAEPVDMPVFVGGFAAAEAELLLHVPGSFTGPLPQTNEEVRDIVDAVRIGIEIASSPYARINADGPLVTASDFGNNAGLVIGPELAEWRDIDLCAIQVRTEIDGVVVGEATAATMLDGPFGAVRFLVNNLAARGIDRSGGIWVSTGAITGVHPIAPGQTAVATFGELGKVSCRAVAAKPA